MWDAAECLKSCQRKFSISACLSALVNDLLKSNGLEGSTELGKTRDESCFLFLLFSLYKLKACPETGTLLLWPFLVFSKISIPSFRSMSLHFNDHISIRLAPVDSAKTHAK